MSPALVHGKVDLWLRGREAWIAEGGTARRALVNAWRKIAVDFGAGHPAALGCLLALVREAYGNPLMDQEEWLDRDHVPWFGVVMHLGEDETAESRGRSEAEALVAALEAAP